MLVGKVAQGMIKNINLLCTMPYRNMGGIEKDYEAKRVKIALILALLYVMALNMRV